MLSHPQQSLSALAEASNTALPRGIQGASQAPDLGVEVLALALREVPTPHNPLQEALDQTSTAIPMIIAVTLSDMHTLSHMVVITRNCALPPSIRVGVTAFPSGYVSTHVHFACNEQTGK
jgi:hypothetical protein